jgi:hypothetical protein
MLEGNARLKFFDTISRCSEKVVVIVALLAFSYAARNAYSGLGQYGDWYDQGVYLESARLMLHGFQPYKDIFDSQPPLWLPLLYLSFHIFGINLLAAQILTATSGMVVAIAVMLATAQLTGRASGLFASLLIILSPLELQWSRVVVAEVPFAAFASIGMALAIRYLRNGNRWWLVAAACAIACSVLIKLLGLFVLPALVALVIARWASIAEIDRDKWSRFMAGDIAIIAVTTAVVIGSCLLPTYREQMWNQVVGFHLAARSAFPSLPITQRIFLMYRFMKEDRLLIAASPLALFCLMGGFEGVAILAWPAFTFVGLMYQRPLFSHHMIALIPALAVAVGVGSGYCIALSRKFLQWCATESNRMRTAWSAAYLAAVVAAAVVLMRQGWIAANQQEALVWNSLDERLDIGMAQTIDENTGPDEMIATDAQSVAFLAERDVPPELADTSFLRIKAGYLSSQEFIAASEKYRVRMVLFWTGRLNTMPGLVEWARANFSRHLEVAPGRVLYMTDDLSTKRLTAGHLHENPQ